MKVAVIAFNNLKFSPYIFPYMNMLEKTGAQIELIYPNRSAIKEDFSYGKLTEIKWDASKNKLLNFLSFRRDVTKILKKSTYDFVIVLTTFPAVLLSSVLKSRYKGKYLVDIRDFTHEENSIYYKLEEKALKNAAVRTVSSPGFKNFLPNLEYHVFQNISSSYREGEKCFSKREEGKIIIGYVGTIGYAGQCKKTIDLVKNDERFAFYFFGNENGEKPVNKYVEELGCDRIKCFGEYSPSEKNKIIESVDIMFNAYGNGKMLLRYALSNKLYDSMYFKKPLLVSPDTDMHIESGEYSYAIDFEKETSLDGLHDWYMNINAGEFNSYGDEYIKNVFKGNDKFESVFSRILEAGKNNG